MNIKFNDYCSYHTIVASFSHVADANFLGMLANEDESFFMTNVGNGDGLIFRFGAVGTNWQEISDALSCSLQGFTGLDKFLHLCRSAYESGYSAIHFDVTAEKLPGASWYTLDSAEVVPLAYGVEIVDFHQLTSGQQESEIDQREDPTSNLYFIVDGVTHCISDFMRCDIESLNFIDAYQGESTFSMTGIKLSGDSETLDFYRIIG